MQEALDWIVANLNSISGFVILLVVVVAFIYGIGTGRVYFGKNVDKILAGKQADLDTCRADLAACRRVTP